MREAKLAVVGVVEMCVNCEGCEINGLPEAEVFQRYLAHIYGLQADYLETQSTNCGNNITYLLDMIRDKNIPCKSIILTQDATMQMDTVLRGKILLHM